MPSSTIPTSRTRSRLTTRMGEPIATKGFSRWQENRPKPIHEGPFALHMIPSGHGAASSSCSPFHRRAPSGRPGSVHPAPPGAQTQDGGLSRKTAPGPSPLQARAAPGPSRPPPPGPRSPGPESRIPPRARWMAVGAPRAQPPAQATGDHFQIRASGGTHGKRTLPPEARPGNVCPPRRRICAQPAPRLSAADAC